MGFVKLLGFRLCHACLTHKQHAHKLIHFTCRLKCLFVKIIAANGQYLYSGFPCALIISLLPHCSLFLAKNNNIHLKLKLKFLKFQKKISLLNGRTHSSKYLPSFRKNGHSRLNATIIQSLEVLYDL